MPNFSHWFHAHLLSHYRDGECLMGAVVHIQQQLQSSWCFSSFRSFGMFHWQYYNRLFHKLPLVRKNGASTAIIVNIHASDVWSVYRNAFWSFFIAISQNPLIVLKCRQKNPYKIQKECNVSFDLKECILSMSLCLQATEKFKKGETVEQYLSNYWCKKTSLDCDDKCRWEIHVDKVDWVSVAVCVSHFEIIWNCYLIN